jgi:hypothetical protein
VTNLHKSFLVMSLRKGPTLSNLAKATNFIDGTFPSFSHNSFLAASYTIFLKSVFGIKFFISPSTSIFGELFSNDRYEFNKYFFNSFDSSLYISFPKFD